MRILHVINSMSIAGAEKVVLDLAIGTQKIGHEVAVATLTCVPSDFEDQLQSKGIKIIRVQRHSSAYSPIAIFKLVRIMKGFDVVHAHLFPTQYWVAFAKTLRRGLPPIVTTEHSTNNRRRNNAILKHIDEFAYSRYNKIISCSKATDISFRKTFPQLKSIVISNGADIKAIRNAKAYKKSLLIPGIAETDVCIGFIAGLKYPKRHDVLLESISQLPRQYKAVIVGDGPLSAELQALAKGLKIADRCHFLGFRKDIPEIVRTCDINCLLSDFEGLSIASIECMAAGKPFIGSDVPGIRDITDGYGILIPNNADSLTDAILSLDDSDYYSKIARQCMLRSTEFDIEKVITDYMSIYEEAVNSQ